MTGLGELRTWWRRGRAWLFIGLVVLLGGAGIAALQQPPANPYLNPGNVSGSGVHALADILAELGHEFVTATSASAAERDATPGSTLVITNTDYLSRADLAALTRVRAGIVLVEPDPLALAVIAPPVRLIGRPERVVVTVAACRLRAASLAGSADMGGENLLVRGPMSQQCYASTSGPTLVQLQLHGRTVTVLGTSAPLTNARLAADGNAALCINLLPTHRIVWLVPNVASATAAAGSGPKTFASLVPLAAYLVIIQLVVAALLAAAWRARRLGRLVAEPLPVVVRAAETTEGHGRLYQARRARAQAAEALRSATCARLERAAGLPPGSVQHALVGTLVERTARPAAAVTELLYGPAPRTDEALVLLAHDLDQLEREAGMT